MDGWTLTFIFRPDTYTFAVLSEFRLEKIAKLEGGAVSFSTSARNASILVLASWSVAASFSFCLFACSS